MNLTLMYVFDGEPIRSSMSLPAEKWEDESRQAWLQWFVQKSPAICFFVTDSTDIFEDSENPYLLDIRNIHSYIWVPEKVPFTVGGAQTIHPQEMKMVMKTSPENFKHIIETRARRHGKEASSNVLPTQRQED